ncbi:hypothetical protein CROQUDRAFT_103153 [Cronartium quercuum f. sp. fusiforme G11]|uniref:Uncharacterized protein n=1 Tax=Cronartium quercuum f. sp. fusiforme G11 TaxID=708437 RepID=A0A9P6THK5_9BASI|nr:hypothetical protein CROQUDRAFT_103153 [Cronartium quercuum f. sp. fusiforme G11]
MFFLSLVLLLCSSTQVILSGNLPPFPDSPRESHGYPPMRSSRNTKSSSELRAELMEEPAARGSITEHVFHQKISHFPADPKYAPHVDGTFPQRYWIDTSFYRRGGPVFLLHSGQLEGTLRIPFLQKGILRLLTETFGGVGVILEMRYYGTSFPTKDLSTDSMRFLDIKQSLADVAYFSQKIVFPGLEAQNLTASKAAWIHYGGKFSFSSTAGAQAAYMKLEYPELTWGAIASSATVEAIVSFSAYWQSIEETGDKECIKGFQTVMATVDSIIGSQDEKAIAKMKADFGVATLTHIDDFANLLTWLPATYQDQNWDPNAAADSQTWSRGCAVLKKAGGEKPSGSPYPAVYHTYANITSQYVSQENVCPPPTNADDCFGTHNVKPFLASDLTQVWRSWFYQACKEEGFFLVHPSDTKPSIVSRYLTLPYQTRQCKQAFPPGAHNRLPATPEVSRLNSYGGVKIEADRLAFIDGEFDPWIHATPHSPSAPHRTSTSLRPFYLINKAVHHWDENGIGGGLSNPKLPQEIRDVLKFEVDFVSSWLDDYNKIGGGHSS